MNFNKLALVLLLIIISVAAFGCSSGTEATKEVATVAEGQKVSMPEEKPTLTGKVKEIVGNEVTVYKVEVVQSEEAPKEATANQEQNQANKSASPGGRMKVTEETETFIIPVGTPIVTMQRGTKEVNEVGLAEIKKDQMLRIWKEDDTVSFVQMMGGSRDKSGNRQGGGGNGGGMGMGPGGGPGSGGNK